MRVTGSELGYGDGVLKAIAVDAARPGAPDVADALADTDAVLREHAP